MQLVYCMSLIKIGIVLYTHNHSNMLISKFQSSMFMISILRYANMVASKSALMLLYLLPSLKESTKSNNAYCTQLTSCLRFVAWRRFISQMIQLLPTQLPCEHVNMNGELYFCEQPRIFEEYSCHVSQIFSM